MFEPTEDWIEKQDLDEYTLSKVRGSLTSRYW
jgi:hypothetical protein